MTAATRYLRLDSKAFGATALFSGLGLLTGCSWFSDSAPLPEVDSGAALLQASQRALEFLPDRETLHWVDPETEEPARVTVLQTTATDEDGFCRLLLIEAGARPGDPVERFCRDDETGTWRFDRRLTEAEAERVVEANEPQASR